MFRADPVHFIIHSYIELWRWHAIGPFHQTLESLDYRKTSPYKIFSTEYLLNLGWHFNCQQDNNYKHKTKAAHGVALADGSEYVLVIQSKIWFKLISNTLATWESLTSLHSWQQLFN